jgi:hypothetical protein
VVLLGRLLLGFVGNELGEGDSCHMSKTTREQVTYSEPNTKEKPHAQTINSQSSRGLPMDIHSSIRCLHLLSTVTMLAR